MEASPNLACAAVFQSNAKPLVKYIFSSVQAVKLLKASPILSFSSPNINLANHAHNLKLLIFLEKEIRSRKEEKEKQGVATTSWIIVQSQLPYNSRTIGM